MTVNELVGYLKSFHSDDEEIAVIAAWPEKRVFYDTALGAFIDTDHPVLVVQISAEHSFNEADIKEQEA